MRDAPIVEFDAAGGNPITTAGGPQELAMSGHWALIEPLEPGPHSVIIRSSNGDFSLDVSYILIVE